MNNKKARNPEGHPRSNIFYGGFSKSQMKRNAEIWLGEGNVVSVKDLPTQRLFEIIVRPETEQWIINYFTEGYKNCVIKRIET